MLCEDFFYKQKSNAIYSGTLCEICLTSYSNIADFVLFSPICSWASHFSEKLFKISKT